MKISNQFLKNVTAIYIILPVIIFLFEWLKMHVAILTTIATSVVLAIYIKTNEKDTNEFQISRKAWISMLIISSGYVFLSGIGKLVAQPDFYYDHIVRNSIYKDLIFCDWPVQYDNQIYLCYYIGHWLVPAFIGKVLFMLIQNVEMTYFISNLILYLWSIFGMFLLFIWISKMLKKSSANQMICVLFLFVFFSGLDIIGELIIHKKIESASFLCGFEWWSRGKYYWQYASFTSVLYWSYNQFIVPMLITTLLLDNKEKQNRGMFLTVGLLFGPYPMLGLGMYLLTMDLIEVIKYKSLKIVKSYFSIQNIISAIFILPIMILYFKANWKITYHMIQTPEGIKETDWFTYVLFILLEFAIYVILIFRKNDKNAISLIVITVYLFILPFYKQQDFVMRVSIPFIFILWMNIVEFIFDVNANQYQKSILVILLIIGALNPLCEINRAVYRTIQQGHLGSEIQEVNILYEVFNDFQFNYVSSPDSIFFRYLAKED